MGYRTQYMLTLTLIFLSNVYYVIYLCYEWTIGKFIRRMQDGDIPQHSIGDTEYKNNNTSNTATTIYNAEATSSMLRRRRNVVHDEVSQQWIDDKRIKTNMNKLTEFEALINNLRTIYKNKSKSENKDHNQYSKQLNNIKIKMNKLFDKISNLIKQSQDELLLQIETETLKLNYVDIKLNETQDIINNHRYYLNHKNNVINKTENNNDMNINDIFSEIQNENEEQINIIKQNQKDVEQFIDEYESKMNKSQINKLEKLINHQIESQYLYTSMMNILDTAFGSKSTPNNISSSFLGLQHDINTTHYPIDYESDDDMKTASVTSEGLINMIPKLPNIYYLTQDTDTFPNGLYVSNIENKYNQIMNKVDTDYKTEEKEEELQTKCECNIYQLSLNKENTLFTKSKKWVIQYSGLCLQRNMEIPENILAKIKTLYNDTMDNNDNVVIFKCGGYNQEQTKILGYCSAMILKETECINGSTTDGYNWKLPSLPQRILGNQLVYDIDYGLLSIGGNDCDSFYRLSFDFISSSDDSIPSISSSQSISCSMSGHSDNNKGWQWEVSPAMNVKRGFAACIGIDGQNKIMAIGGISDGMVPIQSVELFDFEIMQWNLVGYINYSRYECGSLYNKYVNKIYIAGGCGKDKRALNSCEYFDFYKNQWYMLPYTHLFHYNYPLLWYENDNNFGNNHQIMYIASIESNGMEYIDLRENHNKWNIIFNSRNSEINSIRKSRKYLYQRQKKNIQSLQNVIGINVSQRDNYLSNHNRLLI